MPRTNRPTAAHILTTARAADPTAGAPSIADLIAGAPSGPAAALAARINGPADWAGSATARDIGDAANRAFSWQG